MMNQHRRVAETQRRWSTPAAGAGPRTFRMTFPAKVGLRNCPLEVSMGKVARRTAMRVHFLHLNVLNTVVVLEEGNFPHPRCAQCDMLVSRQY